MSRFILGVLVSSVFLCSLGTSDARAEKKKVLVTMTWKGSVADDNLQRTAPDVITNAKDLEKIWKDWKIPGQTPAVDFTKMLVVGVYSSGSILNLAAANLDEKGNLEVLGFGTRDLRPGFRFVLGSVSNEGVVTVNGKKIAKE